MTLNQNPSTQTGWLTQTTLYTIGLIIVIVIALQYFSFVVLRKMVKNEIGKIARFLLKNNSTNQLNQLNQVNQLNQLNENKKDEKEESLDVDTPTNINNENEDIDSYVNPIPSVDNKDDE